MKRFLLFFLFLVILSNSQNYSKAQKTEKKTPYLSNSMDFEQIERAMKAYPPSFMYGDERLKIMESLDALINFSVKHDSFYLDRGNVKRLEEMVQFYRKRVDCGLESLEKTKVKNGVRIFKFYSSSIVLKSAEGTVAVDFCQGPVQNEGEPEKNDLYKSGFFMTQKQRDKLAKLIDVQIITHQHHDHADYSLASRLVKMGKTVIGPAQLKNKWKDISSGLTVPKYETIEKFGPVEIFTHFGYQYSQGIKLDDGTTKGIPSTDPSMDSESVRYLIKIGGIVFLQSAENQVEAYDWLTKAASGGWNVNVLLTSGQYQGERSVMKFFKDNKVQYFRIPIHEYELMHFNGGNRTANYLKGESRKAFDQKKLMVMLWGEDFLLTNESSKSAQVIPDEPLSDDYEVWINGIKAVVYIARVQDPPWEKSRVKLDFGGNYSFTSFDISGATKITIRTLKKSLRNTILRPDQAKVKRFVKSENEISFTINKPIKLSIEPDGKNAPLLIFANRVNDYKILESDKNVIFYGPGIHKPDSALIRLRDNQTLYLAEGAIVKAGVIVSGNNTKICGRGILDGNEFIWGKGARNMVLIKGNNVVVRDIIIRGAATWTMPIMNCNNVVIENVKILGGRAQNDDGINPCNAQDVVVKNCFIRTDDDCLALKGLQSPPNNKSVERITVENTILWCDRARVFLLGHESRAEYMRNIIFRNIDILHFSMTAFLLEPGEEMKLQNVLFENFRINGEGQKELIRLKPTINQYMRTKVPGFINDITFKNVSVTGKFEGDYSIQLTGADEKHAVSGVILSGISISGNKIKTGSKNLKIDNYVDKVSIK